MADSGRWPRVTLSRSLRQEGVAAAVVDRSKGNRASVHSQRSAMMCTYMLRRSGRDWTFVLVDESGRPIARGKLHASRAFALRAIEEIRALSTNDAAFERLTTEGGLHAFAIATLDKRRLAGSSFFASDKNRDAALGKCRKVCGAAPVAEDVAQVRGGSEDGYGLSLATGEDGSAGAGPTVRLETAGSDYRLVLFDASDRRLLTTSPQRNVQAALDLLDEFRTSAADEQLYTRHASELGMYSFRLRNAAGAEIARSGDFATVREREDRLSRAKAAAYQAGTGTRVGATRSLAT